MKKSFLLCLFFAAFLNGCDTPRELSEKEREERGDELQREMDSLDRMRHKNQEPKGSGDYIALPRAGTLRF